MRRLLAPFTRWLDRRIDARIAAEAQRMGAVISVLSNRVHYLENLVPIGSGGGLLDGMTVAGFRDAQAVQAAQRLAHHHSAGTTA